MKGRVFKRGKTWSISVRVQKDENNEWIRVQKGGFRTKREAEDFVRELINKSERGEYAKYDDMNVGEFLNLWLDEHCKHNLKPSTYANRENMVRTRIIPEIGRIKIEDLKPIHFTRFYNKMHDAGLSSSYIHTMHSCLRTAFKHAVKWQLASKNVMENVDAPKIIKSNQLQTWTLEQAVQFLEYTSSLENEYRHIAYVLAIFTGMRRGEILGLRWSDIDYDKKTLQVVQTVYKPIGQSPTIQGTKTAGSARSISLPENVVDELKSHKAKQNQMRLLFG
jgi:integrase